MNEIDPETTENLIKEMPGSLKFSKHSIETPLGLFCGYLDI